MFRRQLMVLFAALIFGTAAQPAGAAEARISSFSLLCDGTTRNFVFNATQLGNSVSRFVQGSSIQIVSPRGGLNSLRFQLAGEPKKTFLVLGFNETSARAEYTGSLFQVATNSSGNVAFQLIGACKGGGALSGYATLFFFS